METDGLTAIGMDSDSNAARQAPTSQGNPTPRSPIHNHCQYLFFHVECFEGHSGRPQNRRAISSYSRRAPVAAGMRAKARHKVGLSPKLAL
jgi:hypothetical protein